MTFLKNRPQGKKMGIILLVALIIISVAEIIFRAVAMGMEVLNTANMGEQLAVIALAVAILILTKKGKERTCYILYGAWLAYFVMDQIFELPGIIGTLLANISTPIIILSVVLRLLTMVCIIVIGSLLVEYMSDGTIYNRAFNAFCLIAILLFVIDSLMSISGLIFAPSEGTEIILMKKQNVLIIFNNLYRLAMVFLFTFFAYDSAKAQLKKANLSK